MAKVILHVSGDFPDTLRPGKTKAVSSLVDATTDLFEHHVYSINRAAPRPASVLKQFSRNPLRPEFSTRIEDTNDNVTAVSYDGLPGGLYMAGTLSRLADRIAEHAVRKGIKPDLVHGHKLTLEGLVAEKLSSRLGCPYALSIQVNTDRKILKYRPDLLSSFQRIYHQAELVFPFSVMGQRICDRALGQREKNTFLLPCTSPEDRIIAPRMADPVLASVFHLKDYANKNVAALIKASGALQTRFPDYRFHLYGAGPQRDEAAIDELIAKYGATSFTRKGAIPHQDVQAMLNGMCGFAMISRRETFGMVFLEALLAGCPVVYPTDWAIDGFFDDASFAIGAPARDQQAITDAMQKLIVDQAALKEELARWQETGRLAQFQRKAVLRTYSNALTEALEPVPAG